MFDEKLLKDPGYFGENRVEPHSDHECIPALRYSLCGLWKFFHAKNPGQVIPGFETAEYDCRGWDDIHVPAHIQMEGWGHPQYCNTDYPWDGMEDLRPGDLPKDFNPVACYVKHFRLPKEMKGKRVFISFQGAESCVAVWLNGQYIGFSSDSFTPHEFELTEALRDGENKLACRVYRFCAGSWLEDQDFLRFSGLYREVYLYAVPEAHIRDIRVTAEPDADFRGGVLAWKALADRLGAISAYAYLGDVGESPTGDKKAQKFEDDYLDELFDTLADCGFDAVTYMPSRNTKEQLARVMRMCDERGLFQISGEDINSPRQSFVCEALKDYPHLMKATYALIGHELAATDDLSSGRGGYAD